MLALRHYQIVTTVAENIPLYILKHKNHLILLCMPDSFPSKRTFGLSGLTLMYTSIMNIKNYAWKARGIIACLSAEFQELAHHSHLFFQCLILSAHLLLVI